MYLLRNSEFVYDKVDAMVGNKRALLYGGHLPLPLVVHRELQVLALQDRPWQIAGSAGASHAGCRVESEGTSSGGEAVTLHAAAGRLDGCSHLQLRHCAECCCSAGRRAQSPGCHCGTPCWCACTSAPNLPRESKWSANQFVIDCLRCELVEILY